MPTNWSTLYGSPWGTLATFRRVMRGQVTSRGAGNDTIYGTPREDLINAGAGNDWMRPHDGNDWVNGGLGHDTVKAGGGHDFVQGNDGNDLVYGESGNDWLDGGGGLDAMQGGTGDDLVYAWTGNDTAWGGQGLDTMDGGPGADRMFGDLGDDLMFGDDWRGPASNPSFTGDDIMFGGEGRDRVHGQAGNDQILGGEDNDTLDGGTGNDQMFGEGGDDAMSGGGGNDFLDGGDGADSIHGQAGDDVLSGGWGDNLITGGTGNDFVVGGDETDRVHGGDGADTLGGNDGRDALYGEAGDDHLLAGAGDDYLSGGAGNDTLAGASPADEYRGDGGDDLLQYDPGIRLDISANLPAFTGALLDGGGGTDTLLITNDAVFNSDADGTPLPIQQEASTRVTWNGTRFVASAVSEDGTQSVTLGALQSIEQLQVNDFEGVAYDASGFTGDLLVTGSDADDSFRAGTGSETFRPGYGDDELDFSAAGGGSTIELFAETGSDTVTGFSSGDIIRFGGITAAQLTVQHVGGDTIFTWPGDVGTGTLTLENYTATASDYTIVP